MAIHSRGRLELALVERETEQISPERTKVWTEPKLKNKKERHGEESPSSLYLSRNGHLEHPLSWRFLSSPKRLYLKDVINRLNALRGRGMASLYSWSSKRSLIRRNPNSDACSTGTRSSSTSKICSEENNSMRYQLVVVLPAADEGEAEVGGGGLVDAALAEVTTAMRGVGLERMGRRLYWREETRGERGVGRLGMESRSGSGWNGGAKGGGGEAH